MSARTYAPLGPDPWAHLKPKRRKLVLDFGETPEPPPAPLPSDLTKNQIDWLKAKERRAKR